MSRWAALLSIAVLSLALRADAGTFRIYEPRSRTAEELAPLVAPLLGPGGAAIPDPHGGKLILQGEPDAIRNALEALRSLDAELHQYRVESETTSREALDQAAVSVGGWIERSGLRLARVAAGAGAETRGERFAANVVVLEGSTAEVWTGATQALRTSLGTELVPVQSGFRVRPRSVGGTEIELEITPVVSEVTGDLAHSGQIRETGASTRVRVRAGERLAIGAVGGSRRDDSAGLSGAGTERGSSDSLIVVRVTPVGEAAASPER